MLWRPGTDRFLDSEDIPSHLKDLNAVSQAYEVTVGLPDLQNG